MPNYHIGTLDEASKKTLSEGGVQAIPSNDLRPVFLDSRNWTRAVLHERKAVSWDTRMFRFKLEHDEQSLGLPTGQHLMIRLRDPVTREAIIRSYTPVSETSQRGYVDILVKVYFDTKERKGGRMTKVMDALPIGHTIDFKGPIGKFKYKGRGICDVNGAERKVEKLVMIAGGSGITPIYQIFRAVMQDREDKTKCVVLDGNRLVEDILCKDELDQLAVGNEERCKLLYTLTQAPESWKGLRGRIAAPLLKEHASKDDATMVLICGPEALEKTVHTCLNEIGWSVSDLLFF